MIYYDMELRAIGFNKVNKAFRALVKYPLSGSSSLLVFDVRRNAQDNENTFLERIYRGAIFLYSVKGYLANENILIKEAIVFANEKKEIYNFALKCGIVENNRISYIFATSTDTEDTLRYKVQDIKISLMRQSYKEQELEFLRNFKSHFGII